MRLRRRRNDLMAFVIAAAILVAAGCGGGDDRGPTPGETAGGTIAEGRMVFTQQGCGACHTLGAADAHGTIGPNLAVGLAGKSKQFILNSIVDPNASIASGYPPNTMPKNYGEQLSGEELNALADFLAASVATKRAK